MVTYGAKPKRLRFDGKLSRVYYVRYREGGKRSWKSTGQKTLKLATEVLDTWRVRAAKGERHLEDLLLGDDVDRGYANKEARVAASTLKVYVVHRRHWKRSLGTKLLRSIEPGKLEAYLHGRKKAGLGVEPERRAGAPPELLPLVRTAGLAEPEPP